MTVRIFIHKVKRANFRSSWCTYIKNICTVTRVFSVLSVHSRCPSIYSLQSANIRYYAPKFGISCNSPRPDPRFDDSWDLFRSRQGKISVIMHTIPGKKKAEAKQQITLIGLWLCFLLIWGYTEIFPISFLFLIISQNITLFACSYLFDVIGFTRFTRLPNSGQQSRLSGLQIKPSGPEPSQVWIKN